ncbi:MAG TPA: hypothetical protein VFL91_22685 [Thermomicrobiales bacterium]|nr:hypothetical protein [Thermomicrobiales bacterium]
MSSIRTQRVWSWRRARQLGVEPFLQRAVVGQFGDRVGGRQLPGVAVEPGVLQRQRRLVGEGADEAGVAGDEGPAGRGAEQEEVARPPPLHQEWRAQQRGRRQRGGAAERGEVVDGDVVARRRGQAGEDVALEDHLRQVGPAGEGVGHALARGEAAGAADPGAGAAEFEDRGVGAGQEPPLLGHLPRDHRPVQAPRQGRAGDVERARLVELLGQRQLGRMGAVGEQAGEDRRQRDEADVEEDAGEGRREAVVEPDDAQVAERGHQAGEDRDAAAEADRRVDDDREVGQVEGRGDAAGRGDDRGRHDDVEEAVGVGPQQPGRPAGGDEAAEGEVVEPDGAEADVDGRDPAAEAEERRRDDADGQAEPADLDDPPLQRQVVGRVGRGAVGGAGAGQAREDRRGFAEARGRAPGGPCAASRAPILRQHGQLDPLRVPADHRARRRAAYR